MFSNKDRDMRAEQLAKIALRLATESSYIQVTRDDVAKVAGVVPGVVNYSIGGAADLRNAIIIQAIRDENITVLAQALALRHPEAINAPRLLKARAVQLIGTF